MKTEKPVTVESVEIQLGDKTVKLSLEKARALRDALNAALGQPYYWPAITVIPVNPVINVPTVLPQRTWIGDPPFPWYGTVTSGNLLGGTAT